MKEIEAGINYALQRLGQFEAMLAKTIPQVEDPNARRLAEQLQKAFVKQKAAMEEQAPKLLEHYAKEHAEIRETQRQAQAGLSELEKQIAVIEAKEKEKEAAAAALPKVPIPQIPAPKVRPIPSGPQLRAEILKEFGGGVAVAAAPFEQEGFHSWAFDPRMADLSQILKTPQPTNTAPKLPSPPTMPDLGSISWSDWLHSQGGQGDFSIGPSRPAAEMPPPEDQGESRDWGQLF